jgi:hypothetical protein
MRWRSEVQADRDLRYRDKLAEFDLVIFDEMGMRHFTPTEAQDLCEIIEERSIRSKGDLLMHERLRHAVEVIVDGDVIVIITAEFLTTLQTGHDKSETPVTIIGIRT